MWRRLMKRTLKKLIRDEAGQALIIVLVLMLVGGLIIAPLLSHVSSGLKTGKMVYEERMYGQYAADAGVEDALYKIKVDDPNFPPEWEGVWEGEEYGIPYGPPDYPTFQLNDNNVAVTIQPYWILTGLEDPKNGMMPHSDMVVVGNTTGAVGSNGLYQISINYDLSKGELFIERIGVWLPSGFSYVPGTSNLEADSHAKYYCKPKTGDFQGGTAVTWDYSSNVKFEDFPGGSAGKVAVTFQFTPAGSPVSAFSWVREKRGDVYLSWDVGMKVYQITSTATDENTGKTVTVEAYATKNETPGMGSAMSGDYVAIGNSLLIGDPDYRNELLKESSATVTSGTGAGQIPANATIEAAYLYWSGWIDRYYWKATTSHGNTTWSWVPSPDTVAGGIPDLNYNNYSSNPSQLVVNAKVNTVSFAGATEDITADLWAVCEKSNDSTPQGIEECWYYTCFKDVTKLVLSDGETVEWHIEDAIKTGGTYTFTLGHANKKGTTVINQLRPSYNGVPGGTKDGDYYSFTLYNSSGNSTSDYTGYPLGTPAHKLPSGEVSYKDRYNASYAGWSLIIIYSSPETKGHQLYRYDITNAKFKFVESYPGGAYGSNPDFDGDGNPGGRISNFLVPEPVEGEVNAAHMTCFVGEGDADKTGDSFKVTGPSSNWAYLLDGTGYPWNNVWNSESVIGSNIVSIPGVDVDTFYVTWNSRILNPGDTWAQVDINTTNDGFTLSYIILSFRSNIKTSGAVSYIYVGG
jgi:hypothetical protein